jgi:hypothetical protein
MTELSFLLDLLLNHKLPKATKEAITGRIKEIETLAHQPTIAQPQWQPRPPRNAQSPSTQRILDEMAQQGVPIEQAQVLQQQPHPLPVTQIAQTAAAQMALNARQEAINIATSGREEKGRTSPRKF